MPESIPIEIVRSIWAFTPAVICFVTAAIVYGICHHILNSTFPELTASANKNLRTVNSIAVAGVIRYTFGRFSRKAEVAALLLAF